MIIIYIGIFAICHNHTEGFSNSARLKNFKPWIPFKPSDYWGLRLTLKFHATLIKSIALIYDEDKICETLMSYTFQQFTMSYSRSAFMTMKAHVP